MRCTPSAILKFKKLLNTTNVCFVLCSLVASCVLLATGMLQSLIGKPQLYSIKNLRVSTLILRTMTSEKGPVAAAIFKKLSDITCPEHLEVINESYMHNVPKGSETHFKVVVVSDKFEGLPLIKRHRMVNDILQEELKYGVHALSIMAKTPSQWQDSTKNVEPSPACKGGFGK